MATSESNSDYEVIFVASFYSKKAGRRIYARDYGKKAFAIRVKRKAN